MTRPKIGQGHGDSGFTLIEVLAGSVILVFLGLGVIGLQQILANNQTVLWDNFFSVDQTNRSLDLWARELRSARYGDNGAYPLASLSDQTISFYSDIDNDNQTEKIRYFLENGELKRGVIQPQGLPADYPPSAEQITVLAQSVVNGVNPLFYYYNENWPADTVNNPLAEADRLAQTKLVKASLKLNPKLPDPAGEYFLESQVQLRLLKNEL